MVAVAMTGLICRSGHLDGLGSPHRGPGRKLDTKPGGYAAQVSVRG